MVGGYSFSGELLRDRANLSSLRILTAEVAEVAEGEKIFIHRFHRWHRIKKGTEALGDREKKFKNRTRIGRMERIDTEGKEFL